MKKIIMFAIAMSVGAALSASADGAKDNWDTKCAKCHGSDGKGQTNMGKRLGARDYTDPQVQASVKDEDAAKAITDGFKDTDGKTLMKPVASLSDDDVKGLVAYMRTFKK